jgi:hypothetical protein
MTQLQLFATIFLIGFGIVMAVLAFIILFGGYVYKHTKQPKKKPVNLESAGIYTYDRFKKKVRKIA